MAGFSAEWPMRVRFGCLIYLLPLCLLATGCRHKQLVPSGENYQFGTGWHAGEVAAEDVVGAPDEPQIEEGKPRPLIDAAGWVFGIPSKILLWDRRAKNHRISARTTNAVGEYIDRNGLNDICVRVNQYAPLEEWHRLCDNTEVGPGWRYTVGALSVAGYTLLPGRLFGNDRYNPYTNSLYIYSDIPALGIQSAAYAKDLRTRSHPGTYAFVNELPVLTMWHQTIATQDALDYVAATGDRQAREESLVILHPHYGFKAGGAVEEMLIATPLIPLGGAVLGHFTGRISALALPPEEQVSSPGVEPAEGLIQTSKKNQDNSTPDLPAPSPTKKK
jgi:hypothetical protein